MKVGINGFGRIGKLFFRAAMVHGLDIEFVGINDLTDTRTLGTLLKYDTVFRRAPFSVEWDDKHLIIDGKPIPVSAERDPEQLKWAELGAEVVVESTGRFTARKDAAKHLKAGAKKVVISAPSPDPDVTVVLGVNLGDYDKSKHDVISMGSCTTNSLGAPLKVIDEKFGIVRGYMLTVHSFTNDQSTVDFVHRDLRRARCASQNLILTTTGAAKAIGLVLPSLKGKLDGSAARIPTPDGSCSVVSLVLNKETTKKELNGALRAAAEGELKGILEYTEDPIVTADIIGDPHTAIIDGSMTYVNGSFATIFSWYDNEWGFSCKLGELVTKLL